MVRASRAHNLTRSNEAQREAYQKCFLEYYYCATVQGNSLIFQQEVLVLIYMQDRRDVTTYFLKHIMVT